jgi:hypothetical protein
MMMTTRRTSFLVDYNTAAVKKRVEVETTDQATWQNHVLLAEYNKESSQPRAPRERQSSCDEDLSPEPAAAVSEQQLVISSSSSSCVRLLLLSDLLLLSFDSRAAAAGTAVAAGSGGHQADDILLDLLVGSSLLLTKMVFSFGHVWPESVHHLKRSFLVVVPLLFEYRMTLISYFLNVDAPEVLFFA